MFGSSLVWSALLASRCALDLPQNVACPAPWPLSCWPENPHRPQLALVCVFIGFVFTYFVCLSTENYKTSAWSGVWASSMKKCGRWLWNMANTMEPFFPFFSFFFFFFLCARIEDLGLSTFFPRSCLVLMESCVACKYFPLSPENLWGGSVRFGWVSVWFGCVRIWLL